MQDEPVNGTGDGNTCGDATGIGTSTAQLRAERSRNGNGRAYFDLRIRVHSRKSMADSWSFDLSD